MNETIQTLLTRRSIRKYKPEQIKEEELQKIVKAGTFAASGKGQQPVTIVVIQNHVANYLSSCEVLAPFHTAVYCLNPKAIRNYKKSFIDLGKNDYVDAFVIADFARANRITTKPWRGSQFLALQRLTRHRLHLAKALTREKAYMHLPHRQIHPATSFHRVCLHQCRSYSIYLSLLLSKVLLLLMY